MIRTRERLGLDPVRLKPGFQTYYSIGVEFSKRLPAFCTYAEVAREFGITKQNAYTASVLALGKLVYGVALAVQRENVREFERKEAA